MNDLVKQAEQYVQSDLDLPLGTGKIRQNNDLPLLLQNRYQMVESKVLDETVLLVLSKENEKISPATLRKNFIQIEDRTGLYPVYLNSETNSYVRKELIRNKISFIIPGNQMYLPRLGVSLREHFKRNLVTERKNMSTVAQLVLLYHFHHPEVVELSPSFLAGELSYTNMSLTRAFKELEAIKLGDIEKRGRKTHIHFRFKGKEFWDAALPFMISPVKRTISLGHEYEKYDGMTTSGYSALSQNTMINPPLHSVKAMSLTEFNTRGKSVGWEILPDEVSEKMELQLWRYNPALFTDSDQVDPLSLVLSLRDDPDERIEAALEGLLEGFQW